MMARPHAIEAVDHLTGLRLWRSVEVHQDHEHRPNGMQFTVVLDARPDLGEVKAAIEQAYGVRRGTVRVDVAPTTSGQWRAEGTYLVEQGATDLSPFASHRRDLPDTDCTSEGHRHGTAGCIDCPCQWTLHDLKGGAQAHDDGCPPPGGGNAFLTGWRR